MALASDRPVCTIEAAAAVRGVHRLLGVQDQIDSTCWISPRFTDQLRQIVGVAFLEVDVVLLQLVGAQRERASARDR